MFVYYKEYLFILRYILLHVLFLKVVLKRSEERQDFHLYIILFLHNNIFFVLIVLHFVYCIYKQNISLTRKLKRFPTLRDRKKICK